MWARALRGGGGSEGAEEAAGAEEVKVGAPSSWLHTCQSYRSFTAFYRLYHAYLTVEPILELVISALPKNNYRGIPEFTWELPRVRRSPTFFGNPVTGKSKPRRLPKLP